MTKVLVIIILVEIILYLLGFAIYVLYTNKKRNENYEKMKKENKSVEKAKIEQQIAELQAKLNAMQ